MTQKKCLHFILLDLDFSKVFFFKYSANDALSVIKKLLRTEQA